MSLYKFHVRLFDSSTGEVFGDFDTNTFQVPHENVKIQRYMDAFIKRLEKGEEIGMSLSSHRLIYQEKSSWQKDGDLF